MLLNFKKDSANSPELQAVESAAEQLDRVIYWLQPRMSFRSFGLLYPSHAIVTMRP